MAKNYVKYKKGQESGKARDKKIVITVLLICIGVIILYYGTLFIMNAVENGKSEETQSSSISFYPISYTEDITQDKYYMDLDRQIYFEIADYGTTVAVDSPEAEDISESYRASFKVIYNYVNCAINGDTEGLNDLFSSEYYRNGGEERSKFTAQKLYNIKITYTGTDSITEDGQSYDTYSYTLEYMIYKNNGTFRSDMGSNCIKREYFTVTDRDGYVAIDEYAVYTTKK